MSSSVNNVQIVPVNVYWKMEQTESWDFTGLTATSLSADYIKVWTALDAAKHYFWFNTGASVDPAPAGFTGHAIAINTTDTVAQYVTKAAVVIAAVTGLDAYGVDSVLYIRRTDVGTTTESVDVGTLAVYALTRRGRDYDLGLLEGDIDLNFQPSNFLLTAHQYGKTPIAALNQGFEKLECGTTLLETQKAQLKELYTIYGGAHTATTEVYGVGSTSQGKNMMVEAGRLVLKPVNASDDTTNFNMMLAIPIPDSLTFSGENPRKLKLSWQGFVDRDFNTKFNAIAIGDVFQDGLYLLG
jgi:hypothetical protein